MKKHAKIFSYGVCIVLMAFLLSSCSGHSDSVSTAAGGTSTTTTNSSTTGTITGTVSLPANTNAKYFEKKSSFFAQFFSSPVHAATITDLSTLTVKSGSTTTAPDASGKFTLAVTAGTNVEVDVTAPSGNVVLVAIIASVTAGTTVTQNVDTTTTAVALIWQQNKNLTSSQIQSLSTFTNVKNAVENALKDSTVDSIVTSTSVTSAAQTAVTPALTSITLSPSSATVISGATQTFTAAGVDQFGSVISFTPTYSVTPSDVGTISSSGVFTAAKKVSGIITVTGGNNISASATITVTTGALNSLVISPTSVTLYKGDSQQFTVYGVDASGNAKVQKFITVSSPTWSVVGSIGSIDTNGLFTASAQGTGQVKAQTTKSDGTAVSITADVTVANRNPSISALTAGSSSLVVGTTTTISATATDADGDTLSYAWSATGGAISGTGSSVTYTAPSTSGTYTITVVATDGQGESASKTVDLTVIPLPAPTGVTATAGNGQVTISWNSVTGAASYNIYMAAQSGVTKSNYSTKTGGMTHTNVTSPYVHTGLTNGTTYYFVATAVNSVMESTESSEVNALPKAAQKIATGANFTCAILTGGVVKCWGRNYYGQLGNGSNTGPDTCPTDPCSKVPVSVPGINNAIAIAAGFYHACVVLSDGTIKCWGSNPNGELGNGTTTDSSMPVSVSGISNAVGISAGYHHTCALLSDATVKCWGGNQRAQLGIGTTAGPDDCSATGLGSCSKTPVSVLGISNVTSIGCASQGDGTYVTLTDGSAKRWGNLISTAQNDTNITGALNIVTSDSHSCVLLADKTIKCWGYNNWGQLGNGTTSDSASPVSVSGITNVTGISLAAVGTSYGYSCAVLTDGTTKCWGVNTYGQLGNGTTTFSSVPVTVSGIVNAVSVATAENHTCAVLSDGAIKCWGSNSKGQLGNGTTTDSYSPISVSDTLYAIFPFLKTHFFAFADFVKNSFWN